MNATDTLHHPHGGRSACMARYSFEKETFLASPPVVACTNCHEMSSDKEQGQLLSAFVYMQMVANDRYQHMKRRIKWWLTLTTKSILDQCLSSSSIFIKTFNLRSFLSSAIRWKTWRSMSLCLDEETPGCLGDIPIF